MTLNQLAAIDWWTSVEPRQRRDDGSKDTILDQEAMILLAYTPS
jgi:hypothetical protein